MKPCRISQLSLEKRPHSSRIQFARSEPKIYCKPLLPHKASRRRVATSENVVSEPRFEMSSEGKLRLDLLNLGKGEVEGWCGGRLPDEEDFPLKSSRINK
jgi:hypothetical protein